MKRFTDAGITLEPRSISACIDLAFRYVSQQWRGVGAAFAVCALPCLLLTVLTARLSDKGWLAMLLGTATGTVALGILLVTQASSLVFQRPLTTRALLRTSLHAGFGVWALKSLLRLGILALAPLVIPSLMLLVTGGFRTESRILNVFRDSRHEHRTQDLVKQEFSDLLLRMSKLLLFGFCLWCVSLMTLDATVKLLFDISPVFSPLMEAGSDPWGYLDFEYILANVWTALTTDWRILSAFQATTFFCYVLLRLAWYFTYMDLRIRRDCWDLEVALADEALHWEPVSDVAS